MPLRHALLVVEENSLGEALAVKGLLGSGQVNEVEVIRHGGKSIADLLAPNGVSPSLIVLEIDKPETNAMPILRELRSHEHTRYVPIVMLSCEQPEECIREYLNEGVDQVLERPAEPAAYIKHVAIIAEAWLAKDQRPAQNLPKRIPPPEGE
jgi:CheY-like chemotaxis protein